jgi:hypothetical protein
MATTKNGFVVTAGKNGHWFFRSFHPTEACAIKAQRRMIDVDALRIVGAAVTFTATGNVRMWTLMPN